MAKKGYGAFMGHDKEPPQPHGPKPGGKVAVHSHSAKMKTKILPKRGAKRAM